MQKLIIQTVNETLKNEYVSLGNLKIVKTILTINNEYKKVNINQKGRIYGSNILIHPVKSNHSSGFLSSFISG